MQSFDVLGVFFVLDCVDTEQTVEQSQNVVDLQRHSP